MAIVYRPLMNDNTTKIITEILRDKFRVIKLLRFNYYQKCLHLHCQNYLLFRYLLNIIKYKVAYLIFMGIHKNHLFSIFAKSHNHNQISSKPLSIYSAISLLIIFSALRFSFSIIHKNRNSPLPKSPLKQNLPMHPECISYSL